MLETFLLYVPYSEEGRQVKSGTGKSFSVVHFVVTVGDSRSISSNLDILAAESPARVRGVQ
jgi:hypothetical protein